MKKNILVVILLTLAMHCFAGNTITVIDNHVRIRTLPSLNYSQIITSVDKGQNLMQFTNKKQVSIKIYEEEGA